MLTWPCQIIRVLGFKSASACLSSNHSKYLILVAFFLWTKLVYFKEVAIMPLQKKMNWLWCNCCDVKLPSSGWRMYHACTHHMLEVRKLVTIVPSFYYHLFILKNFRSSLSLKFFFSSHDHCWCNQSLWTFSLAGMMILTWRIMEINGRLVHFFATWDHGAKTLQVSHWTDNNDSGFLHRPSY